MFPLPLGQHLISRGCDGGRGSEGKIRVGPALDPTLHLDFIVKPSSLPRKVGAFVLLISPGAMTGWVLWIKRAACMNGVLACSRCSIADRVLWSHTPFMLGGLIEGEGGLQKRLPSAFTARQGRNQGF